MNVEVRSEVYCNYPTRNAADLIRLVKGYV